MELILWRHAQAEDGTPDLARALTSRGEKDAALVGRWLDARLDGPVTVLCSPARRTRQTADALGRPYDVVGAIGPDAEVDAVLGAAGWSGTGEGTVVVVGHNPWIGQAVARIVGGRDDAWPIRKGGFWWIGRRSRGGADEVVVRAAMSPELLR